MFAPKPIFFWPGIILLLLGIFLNISLWFGEINLTENISIHTTTLLMSCLSVVISVQLLTFFSIFNKLRGEMFEGYWPRKDTIFDGRNFELALVMSIVFIILGLILIIISFNIWSLSDFGNIDFHTV